MQLPKDMRLGQHDATAIYVSLMLAAAPHDIVPKESGTNLVLLGPNTGASELAGAVLRFLLRRPDLQLHESMFNWNTMLNRKKELTLPIRKGTCADGGKSVKKTPRGTARSPRNNGPRMSTFGDAARTLAPSTTKAKG